MKSIAKIAFGALMMSGLALGAAAPASAGVHVDVGVGGPVVVGHPGGWCYNHPRRCGGPRPGVVVGAPGIGVYVAGRGYWDGHRYWAHRDRWHGGWRYR